MPARAIRRVKFTAEVDDDIGIDDKGIVAILGPPHINGVIQQPNGA